MRKLVELIPILKDKDLYILLITISNIMNGRDDNKEMFYNSEPFHLLDLLDKAQANKDHKDLVIGVSLITKELFNHPKILNELKCNENYKSKIEDYLVFLFTISKSSEAHIPIKHEKGGGKKNDNSIFSEENLPIKLDEVKLESNLKLITCRIWTRDCHLNIY